jgi:radical SAM superfamily enzyme YgiQ (UPF0313 family)
MLNIYWLNPPLYTRSYYPDIGWMNFNTYMPDYNWIEPIIDWESIEDIDQIVDDILKQDVDVLCLSTYEWNYILCHEVAKTIKKLKPNVIVVKGGPHQGYNKDFFEDHPYIDYMCYATGHGEYFLEKFLKQLNESGNITNPSEIPYYIGREYKSQSSNVKFMYPENSSLEKNMHHLMKVKEANSKYGNQTTIIYETTRGCPYSCVYCEWGGGISAKVSAKPIDIVKKELEIIAILKFNSLEISDANFGILKRDVEIAEYIAELKNLCGYPENVMLYGLAKTTSDKREKILDIFYENKLMTDYFVAIQTLKEDVMINVKRTDISIEENLRLAKKYYEKYNAYPSVEFIMGLPGGTLEEFYEQMDYFQMLESKNCWRKMRNIFTLLPDSPASEESYMKKFNIKYSVVGSMENEENNEVKISRSVINKYRSAMKFVTETYSYTSEEWKEMFFLNRMQRELGHILKSDVKASKFFKIFYEKFETDNLFVRIKNHLDDMVDSKLADKDILMVDDELIERLVFEKHVKNNKEFYSQYLDI